MLGPLRPWLFFFLTGKHIIIHIQVKRDCSSHHPYWKQPLLRLASPEKPKLVLPCRSSLKWDIQLGRPIKSRSFITSVPLRHGSLFYRTAEWVKQINSLSATEESECLHGLSWEAQLWELIARNTDFEMKYIHTNPFPLGFLFASASLSSVQLKMCFSCGCWFGEHQLNCITEQVRCSGTQSVRSALSFCIYQSRASSVPGR